MDQMSRPKKIFLALLVSLLVVCAVWIFGAGSGFVEKTDAKAGMQPATTQKSDVDGQRPYQLVNASWGELDPLTPPAAERSMRDRKEPTPFAGTDIAGRRR